MLQRLWRALTHQGEEGVEGRLPSDTLVDFMMCALSPEPYLDGADWTDEEKRWKEQEREERGARENEGEWEEEKQKKEVEEEIGEEEEEEREEEKREQKNKREQKEKGEEERRRSGRDLWASLDPTLLADFAQLYRNTLSYKSTRNVRETTELELAVEHSKCTFNPSIDSNSRQIESFREEEGVARHERLLEYARQQEEKLEMERMRAEMAELDICSFKPRLSRPPAYVRTNGQSTAVDVSPSPSPSSSILPCLSSPPTTRNTVDVSPPLSLPPPHPNGHRCEPQIVLSPPLPSTPSGSHSSRCHAYLDGPFTLRAPARRGGRISLQERDDLEHLHRTRGACAASVHMCSIYTCVWII